MAPPMPGMSFPGIIQFASRPCRSTCKPPSTVMSRWPPLIRANDVAESKAIAPGNADTKAPTGVGEMHVLHAFRRTRPEADDPILGLEIHAQARRDKPRDTGGK